MTVEDGLSQTSVNCILQDKQEFLLFGIADGLNLFNGYEVTVSQIPLTEDRLIGANHMQFDQGVVFKFFPVGNGRGE